MLFPGVVSGGALVSDESMQLFNLEAHAAVKLSYATSFGFGFATKVVEFNARCPDTKQKFDGFALQVVESPPNSDDDLQVYKNEADVIIGAGMKFHVSYEFDWTSNLLFNGLSEPAWKHLVLMSSSSDLIIYISSTGDISTRGDEFLTYADTHSKPIFVGMQTAQDAGNPSTTFYSQGMAAMYTMLESQTYSPNNPPVTGYTFSTYEQVYGSAVDANWPITRGVYVSIPCANDCSGQGTCDLTTGACACQNGWSGSDCGSEVSTSNNETNPWSQYISLFILIAVVALVVMGGIFLLIVTIVLLVGFGTMLFSRKVVEENVKRGNRGRKEFWQK